MRIAELEKKYKQYGLDRRTIDYYSSPQVDLIPYTREEGSNYRNYGEEAEAVIKKIIILRDVGLSSRKIKEALENPSYFTKAMWDEHIGRLKEVKRHYEEMIAYAEDMRESASINLKLVNDFDPRVLRSITRQCAEYVSSPEKLTELSENLEHDLSALSGYCATFLTSMAKKRDQEYSPDSDEVQRSVEIFKQRIESFFGIAVYAIYSFVKRIDPNDWELDQKELEEYYLDMRIFGLCAEWFRYARTRDHASQFDEFAKRYKVQIEEIDRSVGMSTFDDITNCISEICDWHSLFTVEFLERIKESYERGIEEEAEKRRISDEEKSEVMAFIDYIYQAIKRYIGNRTLAQ